MSSRKTIVALWVGNAAITLGWYSSTHYGMRKLGGYRVAFDFWHLSLILEYYQ